MGTPFCTRMYSVITPFGWSGLDHEIWRVVELMTSMFGEVRPSGLSSSVRTEATGLGR